MSNSSINVIKTILTLVLVIAVIVLFKYFHLRSYLSIDGLNQYSDQILQIRTDDPYKFILGYFLIYFVLMIFCIPGTIILDIVAGFLFGIIWGMVLITVSYTVATCGNYFVVHYLFHDFFTKRMSQFKIKIRGKNQMQIFISLTALRLIPIIPFWALNIFASVLKLRFNLFVLSTISGILPIAVIYAVVGDGTRDTLLSHDGLTLDMIMNAKIWVPLIILAIIMMLPSVIKYVKQYRQIHQSRK